MAHCGCVHRRMLHNLSVVGGTEYVAEFGMTARDRHRDSVYRQAKNRCEMSRVHRPDPHSRVLSVTSANP